MEFQAAQVPHGMQQSGQDETTTRVEMGVVWCICLEYCCDNFIPDVVAKCEALEQDTPTPTPLSVIGLKGSLSFSMQSRNSVLKLQTLRRNLQGESFGKKSTINLCSQNCTAVTEDNRL